MEARKLLIAPQDTPPQMVVAPSSLPRPPRKRRTLSYVFSNYATVVGWVALAVVFSVLRPDSFLTFANVKTILGTQTVLLLISLGVIAVVTVNEFDLSVGATLGIAAVIVGVLNVNDGISPWLAAAAALAAGAGIGAVNGFLVVKMGVQGLIATLGVGTLVTGVGYAISNYVVIGGISPSFTSVVTTPILGIQAQFFFGILLSAILWYFWRFTPTGREVVFMGKGKEAARLSGLPVAAMRFGAFVVAGTLAALGGVLLAGGLGSADPTVGSTYLLPAYAAVFLGSTVARPGEFNTWGTVIAVYFLATGITGFQLLGLQTWIQQVFYGLALILAISLARIGKAQATTK